MTAIPHAAPDLWRRPEVTPLALNIAVATWIMALCNHGFWMAAATVFKGAPLTLLGMGADMHTASLFPGADRLEEALSSSAPLLLPMRAEAAGEPRITLTAPTLREAFNIHILITGAEKRAALERAMTLTPMEAPVRAVLDNATVHWAE